MPAHEPPDQSGITLEQLSEKLNELAARVEQDRAASAISARWWRDSAGRFESDPAFDEILRLGRQQRYQQSAKRRAKRARP